MDSYNISVFIVNKKLKFVKITLTIAILQLELCIFYSFCCNSSHLDIACSNFCSLSCFWIANSFAFCGLLYTSGWVNCSSICKIVVSKVSISFSHSDICRSSLRCSRLCSFGYDTTIVP